MAKALRQAAPAALDIVRTGSRGMFWLEPLVEVETPQGRIGYGPVHAGRCAGDAGRPDLQGGDQLRIGRPEEIPFLAAPDPPHLRALRHHRPAVARGLPRPWRLIAGWSGRSSSGVARHVEEVTRSGLRGRGGAGFPTGIKWKTVRQGGGTSKYIVCNADEGDSGTFADRMIMEGDPFVLIEGMTIAGPPSARTRASSISVRNILTRSRRWTRRSPVPAGAARARSSERSDFDIEVRVGAGAYVCGEETALLESLEGRRGQVRAKPPIPAHARFVRPADGHQQHALLRGHPLHPGQGRRAYADFGMGRSRGTMPIQLAGNVKQGGLFETAFRHHAGRAGRGDRRRHRQRTAGARGAGRRPARRLLPAALFDTPI